MSIGEGIAEIARQRRRSAGRASSMALVLGGAIGLVASLILVIERFELLMDPTYVPSCSLNPVLSCGSVMTSTQAAVFGFPNPVLGIPSFTVVLVAGIAFGLIACWLAC